MKKTNIVFFVLSLAATAGIFAVSSLAQPDVESYFLCQATDGGVTSTCTTDDLVPVGGTVNQVLMKSSGVDYETEWADEGGTGDVTGPAIAIAQSIPTYNGTTGKIIGTGGNVTIQDGENHLRISLIPKDNGTSASISLKDSTESFSQFAIITSETDGPNGGADIQAHGSITMASADALTMFSTSGTFIGDPNNAAAGDVALQTGAAGLISFLTFGDKTTPIVEFVNDDADFNIYSGAGTPLGTVTPTGAGDIYIDTTNGLEYISKGTLDTSWIQLGDVSGPGTSVTNSVATFANGTGQNLASDSGFLYSNGEMTLESTANPITFLSGKKGGSEKVSLGWNDSSGTASFISTSSLQLKGGDSSGGVTIDAPAGAVGITAGGGDLGFGSSVGKVNISPATYMHVTSATGEGEPVTLFANDDGEGNLFVVQGNPNGSINADGKGDLALDIDTPALWLADGVGTVWTELDEGGGDVLGPVSSVANQIAVYTDTTGKIIGGDSNAIVDDGMLVLNSGFANINWLKLTQNQLSKYTIDFVGGATNRVDVKSLGNLSITAASDLKLISSLGSIIVTPTPGGNIILENLGDKNDPVIKWENNESEMHFFTGDGTPVGVVVSIAKGDMYVDTNKGVMYIAHLDNSSAHWERVVTNATATPVASTFNTTGMTTGQTESTLSLALLVIDPQTPNYYGLTAGDVGLNIKLPGTYKINTQVLMDDFVTGGSGTNSCYLATWIFVEPSISSNFMQAESLSIGALKTNNEFLIDISEINTELFVKAQFQQANGSQSNCPGGTRVVQQLNLTVTKMDGPSASAP